MYCSANPTMRLLQNRKIRNILVRGSFQTKLSLLLLVAVTFGFFLYSIYLTYFPSQSFEVLCDNTLDTENRSLFTVLGQMLSANWFFLLCCGVLLFLAVTIGTHRLAGPLFHIEKSIEAMNRRKLHEVIRLRKNDEGKNIAEGLNSFNSLLCRDFIEIQKHSRAINNLVKQYSSLADAQLPKEEIDLVYQAIQNNNREILKLIEKYRITNE